MNCVNCGKELEQTAGKRQKQYCNDSCRIAYTRKNKTNTEQNSISEQVISEQSISEQPIPNTDIKPANYGQDDCQCMHCQTGRTNKNIKRLNHGDYMNATDLHTNGFDLNRVTLPGDCDYDGVCLDQLRADYKAGQV